MTAKKEYRKQGYVMIFWKEGVTRDTVNQLVKSLHLHVTTWYRSLGCAIIPVPAGTEREWARKLRRYKDIIENAEPHKNPPRKLIRPKKPH